MVADTYDEITKKRLADRVGRSFEEREVEATELIADTLEGIRFVLLEMNQKLGTIADKK